MFHLDNNSGIDVMPEIKQTLSRQAKWFTEGDAQTPPSYPGADWFNIVQAELLNVLSDGSITPDKSKLNQLSSAIKSIISKNQKTIKFNSSINSTSETEAATPLAVKKVYALASNAVKKSGDDISGQITFSSRSYGIKFLHENGNELVLRPSGDSFIYAFYDAKSNTWTNKLRYAANGNTWRFENVDDVAINGHSVLKAGDYGIGSSTGAIANNFNDHLEGGFYQCRTTDFSDLQLAGNSTATLLAYPSNNTAWKVEQLSVVNSKEPRIYYRCDTQAGKQTWYEAITTANINKYIPLGDQRMMPFRHEELPFGWYFRNGDNFLLDSPQGRALNGLSANYKRDHNIAIKTINGRQYINVPTAFAPDGRGFFERAVNGGSRQVGSWENDAIRNIKGSIGNVVVSSLNDSEAFYHSNTISPAYAGNNTGSHVVFNFDASRVVPTAHENRPVNIGMTPVIYLGV
ncbi:phage tail protein [Gilliamella bombi]|uniref:phage tail protein n=1 Tax=Gilliamella bombi TaxID=1908521 RepID=UPI000A15ED62|nr:phage tail protein [Gilliamella bombi]